MISICIVPAGPTKVMFTTVHARFIPHIAQQQPCTRKRIYDDIVVDTVDWGKSLDIRVGANHAGYNIRLQIVCI